MIEKQTAAARYATRPGSRFPPGPTVLPDGVNFCVFSRHATRVELCLYDAQGTGLTQLQCTSGSVTTLSRIIEDTGVADDSRRFAVRVFSSAPAATPASWSFTVARTL